MTSGGRRGAITDLLTTSRHPFRSFDTLRDSAARRQVKSLILSCHLFLWPPLLLPPLTVPCMIVFERPEDLETWPYHFSFLLYITTNMSHTHTQHGYKLQHLTVTAPHTLNNTVAKGFNQMAPPEVTITVTLDMSKYNKHTYTNQKAATDQDSWYNHEINRKLH